MSIPPQDAPEHDPPIDLKLVQFAVGQVSLAAASIPITKEDEAVLDKAAELGRKSKQRALFDLILECKHHITPGLWVVYLLIVTREWDERMKEHPIALPAVRRSYPSDGDDSANELLDAAVSVLESLGCVGHKPPRLAATPSEFLSRFYRLAVATEQLGNADVAYDLLALALGMGSDRGALREEVARHAISLGLAAGRMHQVAVTSAYLANAVAIAADTAPERRLEAFDCCERTLEWLALAPKQFRLMAADLLKAVIHPRDYLETLRIPLYFFLPKDQLPKELKDTLGSETWPARISTLPIDTWKSETKIRWTAQAWDEELDRARFSLETVPAANSAYSDWTNWTIEHPAYRRAVPHHRSFLREADFDQHLLVLTHEMTHVLSLFGGIGTTLTSLRVAAFDNELTLWSIAAGADVNGMQERIADKGVGPLSDGEAAQLFRAQQGVELTLKAHALQDAWTPWFEGLAIFSELAADPSLDPVNNGWVTEAIRNLVDFYPSDEDRSSPERLEEAYREFCSEIETRSSAAIARAGPIRLLNYLKQVDVPYFAGYLAVRAVVSAWRATVSRPLTGTEAFNLLLHATRFSTFKAVPDLSVPLESFHQIALEKMCQWAASLARISPQDIEMFLAPVEGPRPNYTWEGNRLVKSDRDSTAAGNELLKLVRIQLREAMSTVIRQKDLDRFANAHEFVRVAVESLQSKLDAELNRTVDQRAQLVDGLAASDSILPIGRTAAKFFLNIDESASTAYLATQIRTTEKHVKNGRPSVNGFWIPIAYEGSKQVRVNYRELASPRMEITRIIDLAGFVWGDGARPSHMLVFSYGDWVEIRGANPAVNGLLREHPETMALMERLVRGRLYPSPLQRAEADVIARGKLGAARTLDWIHRSKSWSVAEYAVDMQPWADHVMALAKSVLDENRRRQQQKEAARALISRVFGDKTLADSIVDVGFESLAEHPNMSRSMLVDVLFKTAQKPSQEPEVEAIATAFASSALPILSSGNLGWDVRPAVAASAKGAP